MKATQIVHWPGQDTPCCDNHAQALKNLGNILGHSVSSTLCMSELDCTNCKNEAAAQENDAPPTDNYGADGSGGW